MKKIFKTYAFIILAVAAFCAFLPSSEVKAAYAGGTNPIPDGQYRILTTANLSYGLDRAGNSKAAGTNIQLFMVSEEDVQPFEVKYQNNGYYKIFVPDTTVCLDVQGGSTADGANLQLWNDNGSDAQLFVIEDSGDGKSFFIRSKLTGKSLDIYGNIIANNSNIILYSHHGSLNQQWQFAGEDEGTGIDGITAFSLACGIRLRWASSDDPDDKVYHIDKTFESIASSGSSSGGTDWRSMFGSLIPETVLGGADVMYKLNEDGEEWVEKSFPIDESSRSIDITDLDGGAEYIVKMRPYKSTVLFGVNLGDKKYDQEWSGEIKRTTLEANEEDIKTGDSVYKTVSTLARKYGWNAGRHVQYYTGAEFCKYDVVNKNKDFQIWIGYYRKGSSVKYSWRIYDYDIKLYKKVKNGSFGELKKDLEKYAPDSTMGRVSTEYLKYKVGTKQKITLVNVSGAAEWSLPESNDPKVTYGGVRLAKATDDSVVVVFEKKKAAWGVPPYVEAKVGDDVYRCYIDSKISGVW